MKITKTLLLGAVTAAAFITNQNLQAAYFSPSDLSNRAVAASPRAKEQFPWLTRQLSSPAQPATNAKSALSAVKENRSLATSPRMLERFPELARAGQPVAVVSGYSVSGASAFAKAMNNRSFATSPRMLELAHAYGFQPAEKPVEAAPLK